MVQAITSVFLVAICVSGCSKTCADIGCVPVISISFSSPIDGAYRLQVSALGTAYAPMECPKTNNPPPGETRVSCSAAGFSIEGPDLFRGSDPPSEIAIQVEDLSSGTQVLAVSQTVKARVSGSLNPGCDMDCYRAQGALATSP